MTTKKFLTAEEITDFYGIDDEVLQRLVKDGSLKALADRGTWRFRRDDVDGLIKSGRLHATKELPVSDDTSAPDILAFARDDQSSNVAQVDFLELDEEALAEQPTIITHGKPEGVLRSFEESRDSSSSEVRIVDDEMISSSEVELVSDDASSSEVQLIADQDASSSEVQLVRDGEASSSEVTIVSDRDASSSEVQLIPDKDASSSEVQLVSEAEGSSSEVAIVRDKDASSSEVRIILEPTGLSSSDSDIRLGHVTPPAVPIRSGEVSSSDVQVLSESELQSTDNDSVLAGEVGAVAGDSGIALDMDSGIALDQSRDASETMELPTTDSGIGLEPSRPAEATMEIPAFDPDSIFDDADSGISLEAGDSGISLEAGDSGISIAEGDSGISLGGADSGISMVGGDSGIALEKSRPKKGHAPEKTEAMFTLEDDQDLDFKLADTVQQPPMSNDDLEATAAFQMDEESGETAAFDALDEDDQTAPRGKNKKAAPLGLSGALASGATIEGIEVTDDLESFAEEEADEVLEASDDAFSAELDADEEVLEEGDSASEEFPAQGAPVARAPREAQWGMLTIAALGLAAVSVGANGWIVWEGLATMWTGGPPSSAAAALISSLAGMSPL